MIRYTPQRYGIQPDNIDFTVTVYSDGDQVGYCGDAKTEPIWAEKTTGRMTFSSAPTTVKFSCRYRTLDMEEYRPIESVVPFEERANGQAVALDAFGEAFCFASYVIEEQVASYRDEYGVIRKRPDATLLAGTLDTLTDGWYYTDASMKLEKRLTIQGDVNLILTDDRNVILHGGVRLPAGSSLTVWGQAGDTGYLLCDATNMKDCAGIGGNDEDSAGTLIVNGGGVRADGGSHAAGIGGGAGGSQVGSVIINGGDVTARATYGAGIGGGYEGTNGNITINGGDVYATTGSSSTHATGAAAIGPAGTPRRVTRSGSTAVSSKRSTAVMARASAAAAAASPVPSPSTRRTAGYSFPPEAASPWRSRQIRPARTRLYRRYTVTPLSRRWI